MRTPPLALGAAFALLAAASPAFALNEQERRDYVTWLQATIPNVAAWNQWQQRTGEIAPDFDALPRQNNLPDPLTFADGRPVRTPEDWKARRAEIIALLEKYQLGTIPPKPDNLRIVPVSETPGETSLTRVVRLEYGPDHQIGTNVTVTIPNGAGPFPVLIGGGAGVATRGYIGVSYSGSVDQPADLTGIYPDYDFASMGQRAWTAQLVVDYLYTLPQVDKAKIAIAGYSRDGKMATIAAALDERIAAVLAGSTGVGGVVPWRLSGERNHGEGIQSTTMMFPVWFHPRLRYFSGREDRLPVDANLLLALVAPRACLITYGLNDEVSNTYGNEIVMQNVAPVYELLKTPNRVNLLRLPGAHANGGSYVAIGLDWLDIQFGRTDKKWDNREIFPWDYKQWLAAQTDKFDLSRYPAQKAGNLLVNSSGQPITTSAAWDAKATDIRKKINLMLGEPTPVNESVTPAVDPLANTPTAPPLPGGRGGFGPPGGGRGRGAPGAPGAGGGGPAPATPPSASLGLGVRGVMAMPAPGGAPAATPPAVAAPPGGSEPGVAPGGRAGRGAFGRGGPGAARGPGGAPGRGQAQAFPLGESLPQPVSALVTRSSGELAWLAPARNNVTVRTITFGDGIKGDLYVPTGVAPDAKVPTAIWLHSYSYPLGYMWVYKRDLHPILTLTSAGYAVLAYDQAGFGGRMGEYAPFYQRYPKWSLMGKLVSDARAAVDALGKDAQVDGQRIFLFGYSIGGTVALYTAALDTRVAGVVAASGFTPMRTDTADRGLGGLARYTGDRGIMPRLGYFIGKESQLPYDFEDVLACIAPRPALIVQPNIDRDTDPAEVKATLEQVRKVYALLGAPDNLGLVESADYNRLPVSAQNDAMKWLASRLPPAPVASPAGPPVAGTNASAGGSL